MNRFNEDPITVQRFETLVDKWFRWGKSGELMTVGQILDTIIQREFDYCSREVSYLKSPKNLRSSLICLGTALKNKKYWHRRFPRDGEDNSEYPKTDKYYYAKAGIPPWLKK